MKGSGVPRVYFLKTPLPGGGYGAGYARCVRPRAEGFRADEITVPVVARVAGALRIRALPLGSRDLTGRWYSADEPGWGLSGEAGAQEPVPAAELRCRAARWLCTTALGRGCALPEIRWALAQDRFAATLETAVAMPDLLMHEDGLLERWAEERPEVAAAAFASADALTCHWPGGPSPAHRARRRIRLAALRRIDAAAVGREVFAPCPALLGESYVATPGPPGWTIKAGIVRAAYYWPTPANDARSRAGQADDTVVEAFERQLVPWLPASDKKADFIEAFAAWSDAAPLRAFEWEQPWPLFPHRWGAISAQAPPGFAVRISPQTLARFGGSSFSLAAGNLSPFIAEPLRRRCAAASDLLTAWAADLPGLVAAKWGAYLQDGDPRPAPRQGALRSEIQPICAK